VEELSAAECSDQAHRQTMHELRTPLTVLLGRVQMLRRDRAQGRHAEQLDDDLEVIEAAVVRLMAAVERVETSGSPTP
jgi:signal transduction histidine kinase